MIMGWKKELLICTPALLLASCSGGGEPAEPAAERPVTELATTMAEVENPALRLHGFRESFEIAPVLLAAHSHFPDGISIKRGGIPNLTGANSLPGYGDEGVADIATHAETQLLRYSVENPNLRAIMTVTEGLYRIVARRSAGIETLADLKGKRVATINNTSAAYFLGLMLEREGMTLDDVVIVGDVDLFGMGKALGAGEVDALAIWEPESEAGALAVGDDLVEFSGKGVFREVFNLNTTAENLADPEKRALIKKFMRAIITARNEMQIDPAAAQDLVHRMSGHPSELVVAAWPHHNYLAGKVSDLLDVLEQEELWLAEIDGRTARGRDELSKLIDYSLLDEILEEDAALGE